ncbi:DUF4178 domain-containing protein [Novosphingobium resinovorum]|jgi:hypothetical protein|uniref:DUF4178 domain-containing protein n=2 Tax=Sphingomonadaceae TaxID=41297 RepID=UPI0022F27929|nr:DUF4178 domain-containing protein [Novosphingobium resinovorum]GLK44573.1 hypothetical protein GCM10017612_24930 [Novosphingobium resinovorum]
MRSAALPYSTCAYCQSLLLRDGLELQDIGKVAVLPPDVSPIQLGTSLRVEGLTLTVVGRVRWGWDNGSWNEWLLDAGDGSERWLGEAMGAFMLTAARADLRELPMIQGFATGGEIAVGARLTVEGITLVAIDRKEARCLGSEGELPFPTLPGRSMTNIDFRGPNREAVSLQRDARGASVWLGYYSDLASLAPANLRTIEGWSIPRELTR